MKNIIQSFQKKFQEQNEILSSQTAENLENFLRT